MIGPSIWNIDNGIDTFWYNMGTHEIILVDSNGDKNIIQSYRA